MNEIDVRPFRGLRYGESAGNPSDLIAPPYDVIADDQRQALVASSPHNVVRLEKPTSDAARDDGSTGDPYQRAAVTLSTWLKSDILIRELVPALYICAEAFAIAGKLRRRMSLYARVRLQDFDRGGILPHEETHDDPVEDRVALIGRLRTQVSPIMSTYRATTGVAPPSSKPLLEASAGGVDYRLWNLTDASDQAHVLQFVRGPLYIADGHHRYRTALTYRDICRAKAPAWTGDEPENFILMALVATSDLTVLPTHRVIRRAISKDEVKSKLEQFFELEPKPADELVSAVESAGRDGQAFGVHGLDGGDTGHLLTVKAPRTLAATMPSERSEAWRGLDVAVLQEIVLRACLAMDEHAGDRGELTYTADAAEARNAVTEGDAPVSFLLNATPIEQVLAVADAGETMPQKSTYFYPKLPTGLVLYPHT